ncbi:MAG: DUF5110 domain-containing protein [Candidatus Goldbacteria bacterium]|nr:DUF5110 domain-containing protein [Candidatus Goldiibacteriota bacterium]
MKKLQNGVEVDVGDKILRILLYSPGIVRVSFGKKNRIKSKKSLSVVMTPEKTEFLVFDNSKIILIKTKKLNIVIKKENGKVYFHDLNKKILLKEGTKTTTEDEVKQEFFCNKKDGLYGLGQYEEDFFNYKNCEVLMVQANRVIVNPFLASTSNWGILWDNYSKTIFKSDVENFSLWSEEGGMVDYYFVYGDGIDGVISKYRTLTGAQPMFPKWALGFWQSKERYLDQDELVYVLQEYRKRKVPIDAIVQDWRYWGENEYFSGMIWNKYRYPDPEKMMQNIHKLNAHLMASLWPCFGEKTQIYKEMKEKGHLFPFPHWTGGRVYDAFSEEARNVYWKYVKKGLYDIGLDAYWMDGSEAEFLSAEDRFVSEEYLKANKKNALGTMKEYLNAFSLMTTKGVSENYRKTEKKKRLFILTRSSFAGQQRNAAASWSGDTFAGWEILKAQIPAAINFSVSGIPYWTGDVGAFYPFFKYKNPLNDKNYKELYMRWFQFITFTPILRVHGTACPREIWRFGDEGSQEYKTQVKYINLRYKLLPYIYSTAAKVTNEGFSFIRPLASEFPDDGKSKNCGTQYFFGKSIMVCPVYKSLYSEPENKGTYIYYKNLFTPDGREHGLTFEIYKGTDFKNLVRVRKIDTSSMGWSGNIPPEIDCEYSQRWRGKILSEEAGLYDFSAIVDGSLRIWFDGKLVVDAWKNRDERRFNFKVKLEENTKYDIKLEHQQFKIKQAVMQLNWYTPGMKLRDKKKFMSIYLPPAKKWYDFWTGATLAGGRVLNVKPFYDVIPLFVKSGSIIPIGPEIQWATEKPADPIEIRVYTGEDASFDLYEDENDGYNYEKGIYSIIPFRWDEKKKILLIGRRQGKFPGMLNERKFNVVFVRPGAGAGDVLTKRPDRIVKYDGREIIVGGIR